MYILGINAYHGGASACLIRDGQLIAAVEEERFNRTKYWAGFPVQSIRYVLSVANITYDLDHIGISRDPKANLLQAALFAFRQRPSLDLVREPPAKHHESGHAQERICEASGRGRTQSRLSQR